ncbi:Putative two-component membrane permease complex subunit [Halomicronema hongdechloris C2206]|uniref:Two-component membrane permease complex subunit n=1 Tax=Halomicronema hongdechloris C2206 TaxID=1641165 RepID=A0A1Z3HM11_9CYAN|nr:permease [Halomicronema hongdechloris]ASC71315.1 Putative two-component membrane permease complex subunit [Halomicronema hongdechloris C2206]
MTQLHNGTTLFLSLLVEAMPFLLLGVAFSSLLLLFVDEKQLVAALPRHPILAALSGSLVGFLFPVCECGNVPVARRLILQGAPPAVAIGFLLAAPTVNPIVIWATWVAFRDQPEMVVLRLVLTLTIATLIGAVFSAQRDLRPFLQPSLAKVVPAASATEASPSPLLRSGTYLMQGSGQLLQMDNPAAVMTAPARPRSRRQKWPLMVDTMLQEFRELGAVLVIGSAIAATVQVALPRDMVLGLGQGPITSILAMMLLAWVVSICSTVDSFFALSFAATFTSGSLLAFLVFGPMIDLKNISLLLTLFRSRAIIYLFGLAGLLTFVITLLINLYVL